MLKKSILKRITISSIALLILLITYFFPTKMEKTYPQTLSYSDIKTNAIYVLDKNHYVSRIMMKINNNETLEKVREIIDILTLKSKGSDYLPSYFYGVIPENTKINSVDLKDGILKLDFSKKFLNTTKDMERKMIESLLYSLTELKEVENIMLFVDGKELLELPFSKEKLPTLLNKNFGINKTYDIDNIKNTTKTTIYYGSKVEDYFYYVPITYIENNYQEKIEVIIERLKTSPIYESNLVSYLHANAEVANYEILEQEIKLSFNNYLLDDVTKENVLEEVKYTIYLSLRDTYQVKQVEFTIKGDEEKNINFVMNSLE